MNLQFIEATNGPNNWGKFAVGHLTPEEWARPSAISPSLPLLYCCGWGVRPEGYVWVLDLQTGEGAFFRPGGNAHADLTKHRIWVCPLFEPFLEWLYKQPDLTKLPAHVDLPDAEFKMQGHRRPGPSEDSMESRLWRASKNRRTRK